MFPLTFNYLRPVYSLQNIGYINLFFDEILFFMLFLNFSFMLKNCLVLVDYYLKNDSIILNYLKNSSLQKLFFYDFMNKLLL